MAPPQAILILCQMEYTSVQVSYLWFPGGCHICPRAAGLTSIMAQEVTRIVAPFCPWRLFESDSNNGPPSPNHSNLVSDEVYICSDLLLMISWWLPSLANSLTPDFNNGPGNDFNSDVSKQIRLCTGSGAPPRNRQVTCTKHSCGVISLDMLMSLGQPTIRLRGYG